MVWIGSPFGTNKFNLAGHQVDLAGHKEVLVKQIGRNKWSRDIK